MPPADPSAPNWRRRGVIARSVGIVAIALGFVIGMDGLDDPTSHSLQTALGLLATGIVAQAYGLYCRVKQMQ